MPAEINFYCTLYSFKWKEVERGDNNNYESELMVCSQPVSRATLQCVNTRRQKRRAALHSMTTGRLSVDGMVRPVGDV